MMIKLCEEGEGEVEVEVEVEVEIKVVHLNIMKIMNIMRNLPSTLF